MKIPFGLMVGSVLLISAWSSWASETMVDGIWTYTVSGGEATITAVSSTLEYMEIPSVVEHRTPGNLSILIARYPVTSIGDDVFYGCKNLWGVKVPSGVTSIGSRAFYNCSELVSVALPESVMSIGKDAFTGTGLLNDHSDGFVVIDGCLIKYKGSAPSGLTIPSDVRMIADDAFKGQAGLASITIPEGVKRIGNSVFRGCIGLKFVVIPSSVTSIGDEAFYYCHVLTSVTLPEGLTSVGNSAFYDCDMLTSVRIPEGVTSIGDLAFSHCDRLASVTIPSSVTSIGKQVVSETKLLNDHASGFVIINGYLVEYKYKGDGSFPSTLAVPDSVRIIAPNVFSGSPNLTSVTIPTSVTSIGAYAFADCEKLTSIAIPTSVTSIGAYAFAYCWQLAYITIPTSVTNIGEGAFAGKIDRTALTIPGRFKIRDLFLDGYNRIKSLTIAEGETEICDAVFSGCSGLTSVTIPPSVTSIGSYSFSGCSGLTSVTIPAGVTSIGDAAFVGCNGLTSVTIPACVRRLSVTFPDAYSTIQTVTVLDGAVSIENNAFSGCSGLKTVTIPSSVTSIGGSAFSDCNGLTSVTIPKGVTSIGSRAFYNCSGLTKVDITDLAKWCEIDFGNYYANPMYYAKHLYLNGEEVCLAGDFTIPDGTTNIGDYVFYGCSGLTSVTMPDGVISIGGHAFYNCSGLTSVIIPPSVTSIGEEAFYNFFKLTVFAEFGDVERVRGLFEKSIKYLSDYWDLKVVELPLSLAITPKSGTLIDTSLDVSITCALKNATIYYTTNGKNPTTDDAVYSEGFTIHGKTVVKAIAKANGCISDVVTAVYAKGYSETPVISSGMDEFRFSGYPISIECATVGGEIHYTVDGSDPTEDSPLYEGPFVINDTAMVKTILIHPDCFDSAVASRTFVRDWLKETEPTCGSTDGKLYVHRGQEIALSCEVGAKIYYTLDGRDPTSASIKYEGPFTIDGSRTLKMIAVRDDYRDSDVVTAHLILYRNVTFDGNGGAVMASAKEVGEGEIVGELPTAKWDGHIFIGWFTAMAGGSLVTPETVVTTDVTWYAQYAEAGGFDIRDGVLVKYYSGSDVDIIIPSDVAAIGECAFQNCSEIKSVTIPASVTDIGEGAFSGCSGITNMVLPFVGSKRGNMKVKDALFGWIFGEKAYVGGKATTQEYYYGLSKYYIPETLRSVTITDETQLGYGFYNCSGLRSVIIPASVTSIGDYAFYGCNGLTSVTIPEGVTSIGIYAFHSCSGLKSVTIPDGVTSIGIYAFYNCSGLKSVTIPKGVTSIGSSMFFGCAGLTSVLIPEDVTSIGEYAFYNCSGLKSVTIPSSMTRIGNYAFSGCGGLTSVMIPEGVMSIGSYAFYGCRGLTSMAIPEGVTSIGNYAFSGCSGMSTIMIPSSVTSIGIYAFQNCNMLNLVVTDDGDEDRVKGMMLKAAASMSKIVFQDKGVLLPIFVPESGTVFDAALKVSITNRVADAVIHCTVDGSEPTLDSPVFKEFTVAAKTTVKAIAEWCGIVSDVATAVYGKGRAAQPVISAEHVEDFHFPGNVVSISCATDGVEIHYTTSGEEPTATSPLYAEPFVVDDTVMIKAIAIGHVDYLDSNVAELSLVRTRLTVATPEISTWKGDESGGERTTELVGSFLWTKIECATENATIHYTTDGSEPTVASAVYERPFKVADSAVITAVAFKDEWNDSLSASVRVTKRWKEGDSLNVPDMQFDGDGAAVWETDRTVSYDGVASMRSGDVGDGQYSALRTVVNGPGTVTFKWKASCEATDAPPYWWDYGSFLVDGEEVAWIDGETDWKDCEVAISGVGEHAISWRYKKDDFGKDGNDCVWVDMFSWQPSFSLVIEGDESATVTGDAGTGAVRISAPIGSVWEAIATEPWIKVMTTTGSGSGTVTYQFTENLTGKVRTGKIIISGEEYTINQMYRVVMSVGVEGRGSVTGAGNYDYGDDVTLTATPDADYSFSHWSGAANGTDNPVTIKIDEACKATAHFVPFVPTATATANELDGVTISWGALAWAEQYRVYRAEANLKPESSVATIAKGTLTWKDTTAAPGKTYYYWVEAVGTQEQTTSAAVTGMRAVSPTGLVISCVSSLFAGQTANCGCTVSYNNGTTKDVTPTWSVVGSGLTVNASGVLTAGTVANDTIATVQASYTESGITKTASAQVTVYPTFDVNDAASGVGTLSTGGSGAWIGQKKESCGGATALRSTGLASGASAWIGCSVAGAGTLTFKWRKSGTGAGKLALAVNGSESAVCGEASDTWTTVTKEFYDSGTKNIRWTYFGGSNVDAHGLVAEIVWTPGTAITVNFDANGGTGTMAGMTFLQGSDKTLTANAFSKTGYTFAGWATSAGGEVAYLDGAAVWGMTAPVGGVVTLYAVWTPNAYTVRFAANGGEGTMADEPMTYDVAKALTACVFTRKGYTFAGWAREAATGMSPPQLADAEVVSNLTAEADGVVTLYAKWTPNSYTVDFNPGQGGTGTMSDQPMTYDEEMALYANLFARTGYTFLGWTDDEGELEDVLYCDGVVVSNLTDEVDGEYDLYAVWAANEYTVRFNANGGEGAMSEMGFLYDEAQSLPMNAFVRTGYTFAGWTRDAATGMSPPQLADADVVSNLTAVADGVVTLYAVWTANPYTIRFNANGGEGTMTDLGCVYGAERSLTVNAFTRKGYAFAGWATSEKGPVVYADGASVTSLTAEANGVVTLYAVWQAGANAVSFDGNGGTPSEASRSVLTDAQVGALPSATCTGWTLVGWFTAASGGTQVSADTVITAAVTFFAQWTANVYSVKFDANGGSGSMADEPMTYDVEKALTACAFTRKGYTFAGWARESATGMSPPQLADGAVVSNLTAEADGVVTLYAKWTPNNYVIDFNPGQGGEGTMSDQPMTYDAEKALYANLFARTGYTFLGWTDDEGELEEVLFYDGVVVSNLTDEVDGEYDLYAVWAANEYTVRFNANGGEGAMSDQGFLYDEEQKLCANAFTRTGYAFAGWVREAATEMSPPQLADAEVVSNLTAEADGVVTLYAQWSANPYTVKFDANGGEGEMSDMDCTYGVSKQLSFNSFTRVGYVFAGWAMSAKGEVAYANGAAIKSIAASGIVTLYAKWTAVSYSVKFNANGGSGAMANQAMTYDAAKTLIACAFTRTGYTFAGWATTAGGAVVYVNGQSVKNLTATQGAVVNIYAKWTANEYTVKFNANGGSGTMVDLPMTYDAEKVLTACAFTKKGYTFAGWARDAATGMSPPQLADGAVVKNLAVSGTVTLYAKWRANGYGVTFNANGGTGTMAVQAMTYDTAKSLAACGFVWTGYHCIGWAVSPDGPVVYAQGASVNNLTAENGGNISLYAVWATNHYTVKFNANGGVGTMADQDFLYDEEQALRANAFTRIGYAFAGWAREAATGMSPPQLADAEVVSNLTAEADGVVTLYAVWRSVGPAIVCEIAAEYRTKADVGVIPVEVVNVGEEVKIAVKGLPSGVKFTAKDVKATAKSAAVPANSIYGTPTKSGVYAATVTVTPTNRKSKMAPIVKTLTFVVRNAGEHIVRADCDSAQGSVKGMGVYALGKKVTLKATAAKGWVFAGWYNGGAIVSRLASYVLTMPEVDVNLTARFISAAEDKAAIRLAVDGTALSGAGGQEAASALSVETRVGMYVEWPVAASALSATTVKVSGLPSGLKFTAKDVKATKTSAAIPANTIYGTPKTASKVDKNGKVTPSKVKITVTTAGKSKQEYVLNVIVRGIPSEGTFNGGSAYGIVTLTVAKTGKISGKYLEDGKTWTLSAAGFDTWDDNDRMTATLTAKSGKEVQTVALVYEDGCFCASLTSGKDSASPLWEAWRNGWKEEPQKTLATKLKGKKVQVGEVVLTVGASGAVTAKGTFVTGFDEKKQKDITYSASCSTVLIPTAEAGLYRVYLYFPPKSGKFDGFADVVEVGLGDD